MSRSKVYRMEDAPPPDEMQNVIHETREEKLADANMAIIFDFGHEYSAAFSSARASASTRVTPSARASRESGLTVSTSQTKRSPSF